ncbi:MAG: c-type cytochrome [Gaiella sp.]
MLVAAQLTTLGKTVLLVVAGTFIVWALITAMMIPKRRPGFPKRLDVFIVLSALLFVAQMGAVVWVTGTQEVEKEGKEVIETPTEPEGPAGDAAAGAEVFASAGCGSCHTLADAGSTGAVGPNLDELAPTEAQVVAVVTNGKGNMSSFADQLSEEQIVDVAAYVSSVAGT